MKITVMKMTKMVVEDAIFIWVKAHAAVTFWKVIELNQQTSFPKMPKSNLLLLLQSYEIDEKIYHQVLWSIGSIRKKKNCLAHIISFWNLDEPTT